MSKYTLKVNDNINCKFDIQEASKILANGDYLAIYTSNDITKQGIVGVLDSQDIQYKYVTDKGQEYILAKKNN
ncbi:MAG: hypothetical protein RR515_00915 [Clostridium sp.]